MEVIRFGSPSASNKPPLLFVHGSYCGAWIWKPHFLPALEKAGYYGAAVSLRGHAGSGQSEKIDSFGVEDYLDDIHQAMQLFEEAPVLVGHSLGGYLVQKYALTHNIRGMILLSSPSLLGLAPSAYHILWRRPDLAFELSMLMFVGKEHVDFRAVSDALVHDPQAAEELFCFLPLLQRESLRVSCQVACPDFRASAKKPPTLVLGGSRDAFVPFTDFYYEAFMWAGELKILPKASHGVMLDACWPDVLSSMEDWLSRHFCKH